MASDPSEFSYETNPDGWLAARVAAARASIEALSPRERRRLEFTMAENKRQLDMQAEIAERARDS